MRSVTETVKWDWINEDETNAWADLDPFTLCVYRYDESGDWGWDIVLADDMDQRIDHGRRLSCEDAQADAIARCAVLRRTPQARLGGYIITIGYDWCAGEWWASCPALFGPENISLDESALAGLLAQVTPAEER